MRVLGIDPGLTRCGLGVVDSAPGRKVHLVAVGVARSAATDPLSTRLVRIDDAIQAWLDEHEPDAVAVEEVFAQHNVRTVMGTAQVAGLAIVAAARRGIPVGVHTPTQVKQAVTGYGKAEKAQVQSMVTRLLGLDSPPRPADAADALALAICHLWRPGGAVDLIPTQPTPAQQAWAAAEQAARRQGRGHRFG